MREVHGESERVLSPERQEQLLKQETVEGQAGVGDQGVARAMLQEEDLAKGHTVTGHREAVSRPRCAGQPEPPVLGRHDDPFVTEDDDVRVEFVEARQGTLSSPGAADEQQTRSPIGNAKCVDQDASTLAEEMLNQQQLAERPHHPRKRP